MAHQVGSDECVHLFADGPLDVNPDADASCFALFELYATHTDVPITSQPVTVKSDKETA